MFKYFAAFSICLILSCKHKTPSDNSLPINNFPPDMHNSRLSLDWDGIYTGKLPCADCEAILTLITLNKDFTFLMESTYLGKSDEVFRVNSAFGWDEAGNTIILDLENQTTPTYYAVGENQLIQLDMQGNRISGELAQQYVLKKAPPIVEKYWRLIELNGNAITQRENQRNVPQLMLKLVENRIIGNGGCNQFSGTFKLEENNGITFSNIGSTKMACPEVMETENKFFRTLETTDNYVLNGDTLSLNKAGMVPLAKLILAKNQLKYE